MTKIIDINEDRFKCEACENWASFDEDYCFDEDGNRFCQECTKQLEEEMEDEGFEAWWIPVDEEE